MSNGTSWTDCEWVSGLLGNVQKRRCSCSNCCTDNRCPCKTMHKLQSSSSEEKTEWYERIKLAGCLSAMTCSMGCLMPINIIFALHLSPKRWLVSVKLIGCITPCRRGCRCIMWWHFCPKRRTWQILWAGECLEACYRHLPRQKATSCKLHEDLSIKVSLGSIKDIIKCIIIVMVKWAFALIRVIEQLNRI